VSVEEIEQAPGTPPPQPLIKRRKRNAFDWSTAGILAVMAMAAAIVYFRDGPARFLEILFHDLRLFADVLFKVAAGCLIGSFVARLMPREVVTKWIGAESGVVGLLIGTLLGAFLPGGPVTIYPVAAAFVVVGADAGAIIAFITSWTLLGYTRALVWEIPFFGLHFVFWRILLSLPLPVIAGLLGRLLIRTVAPHWEPKP
jgi:uncharacterized membrane protein YraQ (UPF0718 family)